MKPGCRESKSTPLMIVESNTKDKGKDKHPEKDPVVYSCINFQALVNPDHLEAGYSNKEQEKCILIILKG